MKKQTKTVFPLMLVFTMVITLSMSQAFAETISVSVPAGTSVPGCETTNECYIPEEVTINVGDTVIWSNDDSAAHTVTGGSAADGPSGIFDSSLFLAGTTYSFQFEKEGDYPYFCMVHPWMQGMVHVGTTGAEKPISPKPELISSDPSMESQVKVNLDHKISGGKVTSMVADGEVNSVIINIEAAEQGEITVTLPRNVIDAIRENEDDDFFVLVDYEEVSFEETKTSMDRTLSIQFPAGAEIIEIVGTNAIPEFGAITAMILGIAIISVIAISSRSKLSLMPRV